MWNPGLPAFAAALSLKNAASSAVPESSKAKRKRPKFIRQVTCQVCADVANDHIHYGAIACYSCRAFFRRGVNTNSPYYCSQTKQCPISRHTRKHCQYCRFQKCLDIGMKATWVMTDDEKTEKKKKAMEKRVAKAHKDATKTGGGGESDGRRRSSSASAFQADGAMSSAGSSCGDPSPQMPDLVASPSPHTPSDPTAEQPFSPPSCHIKSNPYSPAFSGVHIKSNPYSPAMSTSAYSPSQSSPPAHAMGRILMNAAESYREMGMNAMQRSPFHNLPGRSSSSNYCTPPNNSAGLVQAAAQWHSRHLYHGREMAEQRSEERIVTPPFTPSPPPPGRSSEPGPYAVDLLPVPPIDETTLQQDMAQEEYDDNEQYGADDDERIRELKREVKEEWLSPMDLSPCSRSSDEEYSPAPDVSYFLHMASPPDLARSHLVLSLTVEELHLIHRISGAENTAMNHIPVSRLLLQAFVKAAQTGQTVPHKFCLEGYTTAMKRIIHFAKQLPYFTSLSDEDQKNILLANQDMIVNIKSARVLRPGVNLRDQLIHVTGKQPEASIVAYNPAQPETRMGYRQIFSVPWACHIEHEDKYRDLMESIFHLRMDQSSASLMMVIVLFSTGGLGAKLMDAKRCIGNQEFFVHMLYRYLSSTIGRPNAVQLLPKYIHLISQLEEMVKIIKGKKLEGIEECESLDESVIELDRMDS
jgi:hypothetical protein